MFNIVLVNPDIPQNTGNIARLCVGLDCTLHLVHPMSFQIDDTKVKRAGLDYWPHLKLVQHNSYEDFLQAMSGNRRFYFTTKSHTPYTQQSFLKDDCLIFGSESRGLPDHVLQANKNHTLTIPMIGKVRSLNLSNAAAVVAYEAYRQVSGG